MASNDEVDRAAIVVGETYAAMVEGELVAVRVVEPARADAYRCEVSCYGVSGWMTIIISTEQLRALLDMQAAA